MQSAWDDRVRAREEMNREFEARKSAFEHRDAVWDEYGRIRDHNNAQIDSLKSEADREHYAMQDCFDRASSAYEYGDKSEAPMWSREGHEHQARRNQLNAEISALAREVKQAKANAEALAPRVDSSAFSRARDRFNEAKAIHESAQAKFKQLKAERDEAKAEFEAMQADFQQAKAAFQRKLEEGKTAKATRNRQAIDKVNMALVKSNAHYLGTLFGQNAKIVPSKKHPGTIDIYFGGLATAGDGMGHGHAVIDRDGNVTYLRDAWVRKEEKHNDYLIDDRASQHGKPTHKI